MLNAVDTHSTELADYRPTEQKMAKPQFKEILQAHTVETSEFGLELRYPPSEELDKLLKIYNAINNTKHDTLSLPQRAHHPPQPTPESKDKTDRAHRLRQPAENTRA